MSHRASVLIVSPGDEPYRAYCLERVAAVYDVVLITPTAPTWEREFITDHEIADPSDQDALARAGQRLAARHCISGVLTWTEMDLVPVARLAEQLGLPTNPPQAMRSCRDKATARALFALHGVPSAASIPVASLAQAAEAAETIGYPVVIKPASHAGSAGVIRVDHWADLPKAYAFTTAGAAQQGPEGTGVLVEEYLDGPEISVECVTHQGVTTAVAVTRKQVGFAPYCEETAHSVDARDPLLDQVAPIAAAAVKALGVTSGVQHVEMRLTDSGPRLIEVNARIGGDRIGDLVKIATGIDLPRAAADLACGRTPDLTPTTRQAAAIALLYPPATGIVTARHPTPGFAEHTPWLAQVQWLLDVGDPVTLPPEGDVDTARVGFLIVTAPTAALAHERVEEAYRQLTVEVAPPESAASAV